MQTSHEGFGTYEATIKLPVPGGIGSSFRSFRVRAVGGGLSGDSIMEAITVGIVRRMGKRGTTYHMKWTCPETGRPVTESCGTDKRLAEAMSREKYAELREGKVTGVHRVSWDEFANEHVTKMPGNGIYAKNIKKTLDEFA